MEHRARRSAPGARSWGARRLQHHGQVARSRRAARQAASPAPGVMPLSSAPSSSQSVPPPASSRRRCLTSSGSRVAQGTRCPGAKKMLQAPKKAAGGPRRFKTTRPLSRPPEPRRSSTASALPNWGQPLSDCTIFFAAHAGPRCPLHSAAHRESRPGLRAPGPGSPSRARGGRRGERGEGGGGRLGRRTSPPCLLLQLRRLRGPSGLGRCRGARAEAAPAGLGKPPGPGAGAGGSRCRDSSLGRGALQPWLKPTDENTERAARS